MVGETTVCDGADGTEAGRQTMVYSVTVIMLAETAVCDGADGTAGGRGRSRGSCA